MRGSAGCRLLRRRENDRAIEALKADVVSREHHDMEIKELKHQIKDQADMVAVVRCKDCIRNNDGNLCDVAYYINEDGDGFCNCGERREE